MQSAPALDAQAQEAAIVGTVARYMAITTATGTGRPLSAHSETRNVGITDMLFHGSIVDQALLVDASGPYCDVLSIVANQMPDAKHSSVHVEPYKLVFSGPDAKNAFQFTSEYAELAGLGGPRTPLGMTLKMCTTLLSSCTLLCYGDTCNGASLAWGMPLAKAVGGQNLEGLQFTAQGHNACTRAISNFVHWLTKLFALPTISSMRASGVMPADQVEAHTGFIAPERVIRYIVSMHREVMHRCMSLIEVLRSKLLFIQSVSQADATTFSSALTSFCTRYLNWRYLQAPVVVHGAKMLLAYLMCSEPVIYRGLLVGNTREKGVGLFGGDRVRGIPYDSISVEMCYGGGSKPASTQEDYMRAQYVIRIADQYARTVTRAKMPLDVAATPDSMASFIANLIMERNIYCATIAVLFMTTDHTRVGVVDSMTFFLELDRHVLSRNVDFVALLRGLSQTKFGEMAKNSNDTLSCNLMPPYLSEPHYKQLPKRAVFTHAVACPFGDKLFDSMWANQSRSLLSQLEHVADAKRLPENYMQIMCSIPGSITEHIYPLRLSRVGTRILSCAVRAPTVRASALEADDDSDGGAAQARRPSGSAIKVRDPISVISSPKLSDGPAKFPPITRNDANHEACTYSLIKVSEGLASHILDIIIAHAKPSRSRTELKRTTSGAPGAAVSSSSSDVHTAKRRIGAASADPDGDDDDDDNGAGAIAGSVHVQNHCNIYVLRSIIMALIYYTRFCGAHENLHLAISTHELTKLCAAVAALVHAQGEKKARLFYEVDVRSELLPLLRTSDHINHFQYSLCREMTPFLHDQFQMKK
jgi:hypothetical protein